jgi:hypothetical protein
MCFAPSQRVPSPGSKKTKRVGSQWRSLTFIKVKEGLFMDNYEGALGTAQSQQPSRTEDEFTKSIEKYTGAIPSSAFLGVAVGAMALSLAMQIGGQGKWGNFIGQWVPTWLIIGLYNKLVKLEGHDQSDRGDGYSRYSS